MVLHVKTNLLCLYLCRHTLQDECRILLLHGLLHLLGHDHELGDEEAEIMSRQEQDIMQKLGWKVRICCGFAGFQCFLMAGVLHLQHMLAPVAIGQRMH